MESLPIVLVGFALILLLFLVWLGVLFAPFSWLIDEDMLRNMIYGASYEPLQEKDRNKDIKIPLRQLILDARSSVGVFGIIYNAVGLVIIFGICFFSWYKLADSLEQPLLLIIAAPLMWLAYRALAGLVSATSMRNAVLPLIGVLFFFLFAPVFPLSGEGGPKLPVPNPLVAKSLQMIGAGGGLYVILGGVDTATPPARGVLLFYDGTKAWYRPCAASSDTIAIASISFLQFSTAAQLNDSPETVCSAARRAD
ncbi:MAG: hypothetical protein O2845_02955 [Proteobacteria bacterium]|nr:hypothetical protein [Pseudomonadota bacterium]